MPNILPSIDIVWPRIVAMQGETFHTKTNLPFTFTISGDVLRSNRTNYNLPKSEFAKALSFVPLEAPGLINNLVRGPAYIWAILHDERVRRSDW